MARANRHRGEVDIVLAGETRVLRPSFQCLCEIEAATGRTPVALARRAAAGDLGVTETAAIVAAGLRAAGEAANEAAGKVSGEARISPGAVGETIVRDGLGRVGPPVADFLTMALGGPGRGNRPAAGGTAMSRTAACSAWPAASSAGRRRTSGTAP